MTYLNYYRVLAASVRHHKRGHCSEYSGVAVNLLLRDGIKDDRINLLKGSLGKHNNHICVVVDCEQNAQPADPNTYGPGAAICDPWLDLVASGVKYFRWLERLKCKFKPNAIARLHDRLS